jgi:hypothetical protein
LTELTVEVERATTIADVNAAFKAASEAGPLKGILAYTDVELVSCDYIGNPYSCILDAKNTNVIDGTMVKLSGGYDNEWGYSHRCLDLVRLVGGAASITLAWLLFPAFLPLIMSLFLDSVAAAVERRHYPGLAPARSSGIGETLLTGLRFAAVLIGLNLLALPLYLLLPGANLVLFYLLNGYLLGREYLEQVALRHEIPAHTLRLREMHRGQLLAAGALIAFGASIPLLNLLVPVLATAFMVHVYKRVERRRAAAR